MQHRQALFLAAATFLVGTFVGAAGTRRGAVVSLDSAPVREAPSGKARVRTLSTQDAKAFVGMLELDAGAKVPVHRDSSDELIYVIEGGGTILLDGVAHPIGVGDLVTMPGNTEVSFEAHPQGPTRVLQVFAPSDSAAKYEQWAVTAP